METAGIEPASAVARRSGLNTGLLRALPAPEAASRVFLPAGTPAEEAAKLRAEGWIAVAGLDEDADAETEAKRLASSHLLDGGKIKEIGKKKKG